MSARPATAPLLAAGLDVGGTKTALIVSDQGDQPLLRETVATAPGDLAGQVIGLVAGTRERLAKEGLRLAAVGVAVPGRVQHFDGTVALAVNLGAPSLPLGRLVEQATGLPCFVEHDARAAASWLRDSTRPAGRQLAYLSVGTGISAGVVIEGELLRGVGGLAGELGHTVAQPDGPACSCGLAGCLEAVAAGPAIARQARAALAAGRSSSLPAEATSADVFNAAAQGDRLAGEIADAAAAHLARAIRALVLLFGLERVVVGGGAAQVRDLTAALQAATPPGVRPLLIAADQEGGQLQALGDFTTPFAGAMALGATGDEALAEQVARAVGRELRALGVNVNYAPVCDLASQPLNPALGIRSFGDEPEAVAGMVAATVRGLQADGVAATLKHFPGLGEPTIDTHHGLPVIERTLEQLRQRELVPFVAGLEAGAQAVMSGHVALPALTGRADLPATLASEVLRGLLRDELGFGGLAVTDALDMAALAQGPAQIVDAISALRAGQDLLLGTWAANLERLEPGLEQAVKRGLIPAADLERSGRRLEQLRRWLGGFGPQPALAVVGSAEHRVLADELARRAITLVRDEVGLLPLRPAPDARLAVIMPRPADLTPADTSSFSPAGLAAAVRRRHPDTAELLTDISPGPTEIVGLREQAAGYDTLIVGTISANLQAAQAELVRALLDLGRPTVTVALRTPWDLAAYPAAATHLCSFGLLEPSLRALTDVLWGELSPAGRLPVELHGLYPRGHGLSRLGVA